MTRDDILRMAREAGATKVDAEDPQCWVGAIAFETDELERFAALVAAAEREACAKVCDDKAKETFSGQCQVWGDYFARAIRARSKE